MDNQQKTQVVEYAMKYNLNNTGNALYRTTWNNGDVEWSIHVTRKDGIIDVRSTFPHPIIEWDTISTFDPATETWNARQLYLERKGMEQADERSAGET